MIEESLFKSNFIGRDGFKWWIGQVAPIKDQGGQQNGEGWGNRWKVRILGYHPYNEVELSNEDLPWAHVLLPTTAGSGGSNYAVNPKIRPGDVVLGFFLDGDDAQLPVIFGLFGKTESVPSVDFQGAFIPFTGYTENIKRPNGTLKVTESSESTTTSQKSPRDVPPEKAKKIGADEIATTTAIGKKIPLADSSTDTSAKNIEAETYNLIQKVNDPFNKILDKAAEISRSTDKILGIAESVTGTLTDNLFNGLVPLLQQGLAALYKSVFAAVLAATQNPVAAHLAGVAAQKAMAIPVANLQNIMPPLPGMVVNTLPNTISSMLGDIVENVKEPDPCVSHQFSAAVYSEVINKIESGVSDVIGGVSRILSAGFNVTDFLTSGLDLMRGISGLFDVNQNKNKSADNFDVWRIGIGPDAVADKLFDIKEIFDQVNRVKNSPINLIDDAKEGLARAKDGFDIFSDLTENTGGKCGSGSNSKKSPPKIRLFGGSGLGASILPVLGDFVEKDGQLTGSIIGGEITSQGKDYRYPPFAIIEEDVGSDEGYGAILRTKINDKGQVTGVYVVSPGESYIVGNANVNNNEDITQGTPSNIPYYVDDAFVLTTGEGYETTDYGVDPIGNRYELIIDPETGGIIDVTPSSPPSTPTPGPPRTPGTPGDPGTVQTTTTPDIPPGVNVTEIGGPSTVISKYLEVRTLPVITIITQTGSGASLKPVLKRIPRDVINGNTQNIATTKFVQDCIDQDDQLVGYVDGRPYYGPFHVHPRTGVKMVGPFHTDTPHEIIYATKEASLGQPRTSLTSSSSTNTAVTTPTPTPTPTPAPAPTPTPTPSTTPTPAPTPTPSPNPSPSPGYGGY